MLPFVIDMLWKIVQKLNVWRLPLYGLTCVLGSIGLVSFILALVVLGFRKSDSRMLETRDSVDARMVNPVHPRIRERLRGYRFWSGALMAIFVTLGILSVICALAAATFTKELQDLQLLKITILVAACCSALITAFNLQGKSGDIWRAFRHLGTPEKASSETL